MLYIVVYISIYHILFGFCPYVVGFLENWYHDALCFRMKEKLVRRLRFCNICWWNFSQVGKKYIGYLGRRCVNIEIWLNVVLLIFLVISEMPIIGNGHSLGPNRHPCGFARIKWMSLRSSLCRVVWATVYQYGLCVTQEFVEEKSKQKKV